LTQKVSYFIKIVDTVNPDFIAIGEAAPLDGLSIDAHSSFEFFLKHICENINEFITQIATIRLKYPSIAFAIESALLQLKSNSNSILYDTDFSKGLQSIPINGLIWIGTIDAMKKQINEKIEQGYSVVKLKVGANNFEDELNILKWIRTEYKNELLILRLDANGAFATNDAKEKIKQLSEYEIHSIEQPIKQGQHDEMAALCSDTAIPIALDEELIAVVSYELKKKLIEKIQPQYIILKPTLHGGIAGSEEWINVVRKNNIPYWITSALESNIGLNAIAQWTSSIEDAKDITHGLGTGQLYTNNINSPLYIENGHLFFDTTKSIDSSII
jgi:o-succinylbenzoate synthase